MVNISTSPAWKSEVFHFPPNLDVISNGSSVNQPVPVHKIYFCSYVLRKVTPIIYTWKIKTFNITTSTITSISSLTFILQALTVIWFCLIIFKETSACYIHLNMSSLFKINNITSSYITYLQRFLSLYPVLRMSLEAA